MQAPKVYLGGSIKGGRDFEFGLQTICGNLEVMGYDVLTKEFVVYPDRKEMRTTDMGGVYTRDVMAIHEADYFIAEVSQGSHGVGYEICEAEHGGKPSLLLRHGSLSGEVNRSSFLGGASVRYDKVRFAYYIRENIRGILEGFFQEFPLTEERHIHIRREREG